MKVRRANPELNDLALYKIHDNYTDNYTKTSQGDHRSLTHTHTHTPSQGVRRGGGAVIGFAAPPPPPPPLTGKLGLSAQLSDEDITLTATLGEDQLVSWMPLIKLWSCHSRAAAATASCYLCHLSLGASAHSTARGAEGSGGRVTGEP